MLSYIIYKTGLYVFKKSLEHNLDDMVPLEYKNWKPGNLPIYSIAKYSANIILIIV